MENICVTAVITTYKREPEMLIRAAKSVLNQTYKKIELIIVDDSPQDYEKRDEVKTAVEALEGNIKYIQHEKNMGGCVARNTGIRAANGEYVAFLDDDDEWLPEKIEKQIALFKDEETALVYCKAYRIMGDKKGTMEDKCFRGRVFEKLIENNFIGSTSFSIIRKKVLDELGGFDVEMQSSQDFEMWLRIAKKYKVDYVDESLVNYYIHEGEQVTKNFKKLLAGRERVNYLYKDYLKKHRRIYSKRLLRVASFRWKFDKKKALKEFFHAIWMYPFDFGSIKQCLGFWVK